MKKRFWALLLAVMMVVSVLPTAVFARWQAEIDLKVDETKTISMDYWFSRAWSISDSSIAEITSQTGQSATIKAKKAGITVLTAKREGATDT